MVVLGFFWFQTKVRFYWFVLKLLGHVIYALFVLAQIIFLLCDPGLATVPVIEFEEPLSSEDAK